MNKPLIDGDEIRLKRLHFRSLHRGCKETDLILGNFATAHLPHLSASELDTYERFLSEDDAPIWDWLTAKSEPPEEYTALIERLRLFPSPRRGEAGRGADEAHRYPIPTTRENARDLRKTMTNAEKLIWKRLRGEQLEVKFRKQHPIGKYIVDFVCLDPKLIIELDGGQHNEESAIKRDEVRTAFLEQQGFKVLRFWNNDVFQNLDGVMETIYNTIHCAR